MYGVAIVGAGPQALATASYLLEADPLLTGRIAVLDPDHWLQGWHQRFRRLSIGALRSACVHHPSPDPYALVNYAQSQGRLAELTGSIGCPSAALFADFCRSLIELHSLHRVRIQCRAVELRPDSTGVTVALKGGGTLRARRVVVASNPMRSLRPDIATTPGIRHSDELDLTQADVAGRRIVVVGGGLTAAQLAVAAVHRGASVRLLARRRLVQRDLDVEPMWLGRALPAFHRVRDPRLRADIARRARGGGSIPATTRTQLARCAADTGRLRLHEDSPVESIEPHSGHWLVATERGTHSADEVWLATGHRLHLDNEPMLSWVGRRCPTQTAAGLPVTGPDLRWPGTHIYLCGGLATLAVGPTARNLAGARMAAERICASITGQLPRPAQYPS